MSKISHNVIVFGSNLIKLLHAVNLISRPQGATISDLEDGLQVSRRSVYRIFDTLNELNFPLYDQMIDGRTKSWHFEEQYLSKLPNLSIPELKLSQEEALVLFLMLSKGNVLGKNKLNSYISSLRKKIGLFLPVQNQGDDISQKLTEVFISTNKSMKDYSGKEELIEEMIRAAIEQRTCEAPYFAFSHDEYYNLRFNPLRFFEWNGGLYLFAELLPNRLIHTLAIERFETDGFHVTEDLFEYPTHFDPMERLEEAFSITSDDPVQVKIWFHQSQSKYIEQRLWSKDQIIDRLDDGSIILSMSTSGFDDIKRWILSYGSQAKVIEPEMLKQSVHEEIARMSRHYSDSD